MTIVESIKAVLAASARPMTASEVYEAIVAQLMIDKKLRMESTVMEIPALAIQLMQTTRE